MHLMRSTGRFLATLAFIRYSCARGSANFRSVGAADWTNATCHTFLPGCSQVHKYLPASHLHASGDRHDQDRCKWEKDVVSQNPLVIFSKSHCPYCSRVKDLLSSLGARMLVIELDKRKDGREIQNALGILSRQRSVPNVFIGGKHIGGCDDTFFLHRQGKLVAKLVAAGALPEEATRSVEPSPNLEGRS